MEFLDPQEAEKFKKQKWKQICWTPCKKHANLQEESINQLYENIDQWQKAYDTLKE